MKKAIQIIMTHSKGLINSIQKLQKYCRSIYFPRKKIISQLKLFQRQFTKSLNSVSFLTSHFCLLRLFYYFYMSLRFPAKMKGRKGLFINPSATPPVPSCAQSLPEWHVCSNWQAYMDSLSWHSPRFIPGSTQTLYVLRFVVIYAHDDSTTQSSFKESSAPCLFHSSLDYNH